MACGTPPLCTRVASCLRSSITGAPHRWSRLRSICPGDAIRWLLSASTEACRMGAAGHARSSNASRGIASCSLPRHLRRLGGVRARCRGMSATPRYVHSSPAVPAGRGWRCRAHPKRRIWTSQRPGRRCSVVPARRGGRHGRPASAVHVLPDFASGRCRAAALRRCAAWRTGITAAYRRAVGATRLLTPLADLAFCAWVRGSRCTGTGSR